jgi:hypothetical protein
MLPEFVRVSFWLAIHSVASGGISKEELWNISARDMDGKQKRSFSGVLLHML